MVNRNMIPMKMDIFSLGKHRIVRKDIQLNIPCAVVVRYVMYVLRHICIPTIYPRQERKMKPSDNVHSSGEINETVRVRY